jgi:hypothetical protein
MFSYENHIAEQELRKDVPFRSRLTHSLNKTNIVYWSHLAKDNPEGKWAALRAKPTVFVNTMGAMRELIQSMPPSECANFRQTRIEGLPTIYLGIIMNKQSKWYEQINFAATERLAKYLDRKNYNITPECEEHFFAQASKTEVGHKTIALNALHPLLIVFSGMLSICTFAFCVEHMILKFNCAHISRENLGEHNISRQELQFIDEYAQFRQEWTDVKYSDLWRNDCKSLQCSSLIGKWN